MICIENSAPLLEWTTDSWNYQDNLLSKYHVRKSCEVTIICSQ